MAFCGKCGAQIQEGAKFCPSCGAAAGTAPAGQTHPNQAQVQQPQYQQQGYIPPIVPGAPAQADIRDAQENKGMAIVAYILFFIPLLAGAHKTSPFVKYHANQGTALALLAIAYSIASGILSAVIRVPYSVYGYTTGFYYTPGWLSAILWIASLGLLALCVCGIINAVNGRMKPLPVIGGISIIK
jgi:uncharacterized membrane protein